MNISPAHRAPPADAKPKLLAYGSYDQTELRRLLAIDAAAYWKRAKEMPPEEYLTQDNIRHRANVAERLGAENRRIQDSRDMMDAEVMDLITAGAETVAEIWYVMVGRHVKRPSIERAVASLCADGRIQAEGRSKNGARIWRAA